MRHFQRTHGVCLRSLAERFKRPCLSLVYERTALQSADVYTKASTDSVGWTRAQKLVNHLQPDLFCDGKPQFGAGPLPEEHKGGVRYDYWTANPWHAQELAPRQSHGAAAASAKLDLHLHAYNGDCSYEDECFDDTVHFYDMSVEEEHAAASDSSDEPRLVIPLAW